jgi:homoserine O-acetyltransferase
MRNAADKFDVEGYLDHQGRLFAARMDPEAYLTLTRAMDLFETAHLAPRDPHPQYTFVGISSDWLFLPHYVRAAAERFQKAGADSVYLELDSDHGHDAFLAEPERLQTLLAPRLAGLYERSTEAAAGTAGTG